MAVREWGRWDGVISGFLCIGVGVGAWHGVKRGLYPADRHVPSIEQICCKNSIEELVAEE